MTRVLAVLSPLLLTFLCTCGPAQKDATVFTRLAPETTGITFTNQTGESDSFNILTNEYIYNGGGVGVGDFDQDGRPDAFFTGCATENKLYLNRGDWNFDDVTATAGVGGGNRWNNGVTVADVNNDGLDDIYVCASTRTAPDRANQLFINQGNDADGVPTFKDMAPAWGIADTSHNTQAAWLDYDRDGDLDLFLLVNKMVDNKRPNDFSRKVQDGSGIRTDKLYRQDRNGSEITFTEVGKETGILFQGFALAVSVCDLNRDGWPDLYVSNDYLSNDLAYLNTERDGQRYFVDVADKITKHTSYSAMGNDVVDMNNDGLPDILAVDMLPADNMRRKMMMAANNYTYLLNLQRYGYHPQFTRNTLQVSQGTGRGDMADVPRYAELAQQAGLPATDWSWTPLVADFDLDGRKDVIITNGFPRDITDKDFGDYNMANARFKNVGQLLEKIPSVKIPNVAFRNTRIEDGVPYFEDVSKQWGIDVTSFSNGAATADFDGDGDLDYMVNNIYDPAHVYRNNTISADSGDRQFVRLKKPRQATDADFWGTQIDVIRSSVDIETYYWHPHRGYLSSSSEDIMIPLDSSPIIIQTTWLEGAEMTSATFSRIKPGELFLSPENGTVGPAGSGRNERMDLNTYETLPSPDFTHAERDYIDFNVQPMLLRKMTQEGPALAVTDWDGDGIDDLYVSGSFLEKGVFLRGTGEGFEEIPSLFTEEPELRREEVDALFFDADGDGDEDLYIVNGGYEYKIGSEQMSYRDRLYENTGGRYTQVVPEPAERVRGTVLESGEERSGSVVRASDYDGDGDLDLFVGSRVEPHAYPKPVGSVVLRNESKPGALNFVLDEAATAAVASATNCTDALWTDYDKDGDDDLLVAGEWSPLRLYANDGGSLTEVTEEVGLAGKNGWWSALAAADFDGDGDIDYLAGNLGENSIFQPTAEEPVTAVLTDMDANGGLDFIPFTYLAGEDGVRRPYPYFNRNDFAKQVTMVKGLHKTHRSYAGATAESFVSKGEETWNFRVDYAKSVMLENTPEGFRFISLPASAQSFPIFAMLPADVNRDGRMDVMIVGNDKGAETAQGFMDAGDGLILLGADDGGFRRNYDNNEREVEAASQFYVPGEGRALVKLRDGKGGTIVVAGQNSGKLVVGRIRLNKELN